MTKEQPGAPQPSHTAGGTVRAPSPRPAPLRERPSLYACFGTSRIDSGCAEREAPSKLIGSFGTGSADLTMK